MKTEDSMNVINPIKQDSGAPFAVGKKDQTSVRVETSLKQIISKYGPGALRACYLTLNNGHETEDVVLVPKMRKDMGEVAWDRLCPEFKSEVLRLFYEGL